MIMLQTRCILSTNTEIGTDISRSRLLVTNFSLNGHLKSSLASHLTSGNNNDKIPIQNYYTLIKGKFSGQKEKLIYKFGVYFLL